MTPWEITLHQYMMGKTQKFRGFCAKNLTWAAGRKSQKIKKDPWTSFLIFDLQGGSSAQKIG